jgi:hypothetical protein
VATVNVLPLADYPVQSRNFGPVAISDNLTSVSFAIKRATVADPSVWNDPAVLLSIVVSCSVDGGPDLPMLTLWQCPGGPPMPGRPGSTEAAEVQATRISGLFPVGTNRTVSGSIVIEGGTLRSSMSIEIL